MTALAAHLLQGLLVLLLQSTGLLLLGLLGLHLTRKRGPTVQSLVGRAALASVALLVLLLPLTGHVSPVIKVTEPTPLQAAPLPAREGKEVRTQSASMKATRGAAAQPGTNTKGTADMGADRDMGADSAAAQTGAASSAPTFASPLPPTLSTPRLPLSGGQALVPGGYLIVGFLCVFALLLLWLGVCQWHLTRLRRTAQVSTTGPAAALLAELTPNPPRLLTHPSVHSPFLGGYHRPVIFLPAAFETDFDADALRAIFVHELTHRDRRDNLWTLAARLLTALLWPQPLLWLLVRRLEHLSEDACDEAVLTSNCPPRAYADCLLSLATRPPLSVCQSTLNAGVAPFRSSVGRRISRILSNKGVRPMSPITLRLRLSIAALTIAAALGGAFLVSSAPAQTQPRPSSVVGTWKLRTTVEDSSTTGKVPYQNIYTFNPDKTGLYRIDLGRYWGHPEFHVACPFTWSEAAGSITIKLPFSGADRVNEQQTGMVAPDGQTLLITARQWQMKHWNGSSWQLSHVQTSFGATRNIRRVTSSSFSLKDNLLTVSGMSTPEVEPDTVVFASGNIGVDGALNNKQRGLQLSATPSAQLNQAQFLAGLTPVQGPGVVVTLTVSRKRTPTIPADVPHPSIIHDSDINQVVNELRAAGAEAVAVNDQRLVATSAVRTAGSAIFINNTPEAAPFVIKAIGDPKTLAAALNMPGGIASQIEAYDKTMFLVQEALTLTLPAYTSADTPRYARPVGEVVDFVHQKGLHLRSTQQRLEFLQNVRHAHQAQLKLRDVLQAQVVQEDAVQEVSRKKVDSLLHQALPQSDAKTLAKATDVENQIGVLQSILISIKKEETQHPGDEEALGKEIQRRAEIKPLLAEEAGLFPASTQSRSLLAQIHALTAQQFHVRRQRTSNAIKLILLDGQIHGGYSVNSYRLY